MLAAHPGPGLSAAALRRLPLKKLRAAAAMANFEPGWRAPHITKKQLLPVLAKEQRDHDVFVASCRAAAGTLQARARATIAKGGKKGGRKKGKGAAAGKAAAAVKAAAAEQRACHAMRSCVHLVPSGSGVLLRGGASGEELFVLTCAHCMDAAEDALEASDDDDDDGGAPDRIGRCKSVVTANGTLLLGECIKVDESSDLALLALRRCACADVPPGGGVQGATGSVDAAPLAAAAPAIGEPLMCCGNPYDWNMELVEGAAPRRNGFQPFHISLGKVDALGAKAGKPSLGRLHHSCWTYWGHSGAPLFDERGCLVGLHNSWDEDDDGQRHGVDWERIVTFVGGASS